jgi:hypothetical protein
VRALQDSKNLVEPEHCGFFWLESGAKAERHEMINMGTMGWDGVKMVPCEDEFMNERR